MGSGGYRPGAGRPKGAKNQEKFKNKNESPLQFMLRIMNDPNIYMDLRARMAIAAAPFVHARKGVESMGKKEEQDERAKKAGAGRFKPASPPIKLIK